jgi:hypothetical protein
MSRSELSDQRQRLQRKLANSSGGWRSGRVDRLEEALRAIERAMAKTETLAQRSKPH